MLSERKFTSKLYELLFRSFNYSVRNISYSEDDKKLVIAVLDAVAGSETPLRFDEIFNSVKSSIITEDRDGMLALMDLILSDHYLLKDEQGMYTFAFGIIKRWWKTYRELG